MTFNFGIIGVGGRGGNTARALMKDREKRGDIVAICDLNPIALDNYETHVKKYLGHGCKKYSDYKELIKDPNVNVVVISVPDQFHHEMALAACEAKMHIFLEKPVGTNLDQMLDIVRAAKKNWDENGKILEIGYVLRYSPFYVKIKDILENEIIGRTLYADMLEFYYGGAGVFWRNWWRLRKNVGGVMIQKICHDLDLCYWFFGQPKSVVAFESNMEFKPGNWDSEATYCSECKNHCPYYTKPNKDRFHVDYCMYNTDKTGADIADNAQILIQFESGLNLSLGMNFLSSKAQDGRFVRIIGSKAEITGKIEEQMLRIDPRHDHSKTQSYYIETMKEASDGHGGGDTVQVIEFLDALDAGKESKAGLKSAYWSSMLVMGAQLSADEGRVIHMNELMKKYPNPL